MAIYIDFKNNFDNDVLDELNLLISETPDTEEVIIDFEYFKELGFSTEVRDLRRLNIVDRRTKQLDKEKYQIFRRFIKSETIDGIDAHKIKKLIQQLENDKIDYKEIVHKLSGLGFGEPPLTHRFQNNNELQIWALIMLYGEKLYRSLSNEGIYFNKQSGEVFKNGVKLGSINIGTQEMRFFEILYDNIGQYKTHEEIVEYIKERKRYSVSDNFLSNIKRNLEEPIKTLISAKTGAYIIKKS